MLINLVNDTIYVLNEDKINRYITNYTLVNHCRLISDIVKNFYVLTANKDGKNYVLFFSIDENDITFIYSMFIDSKSVYKHIKSLEVLDLDGKLFHRFVIVSDDYIIFMNPSGIIKSIKVDDKFVGFSEKYIHFEESKFVL